MIHLEISDLDAMGRAGATFEHAGAHAGTSLGAALGRIDRAGAPWGGDGPGQAFWNAYRGAAVTTVANASQIGAQVLTLGGHVNLTLAAYAAGEAIGAGLSAGIQE